jgi:hypothetical protein
MPHLDKGLEEEQLRLSLLVFMITIIDVAEVEV